MNSAAWPDLEWDDDRKEWNDPKLRPYMDIVYNPMSLPEYFVLLFQRWTNRCTVEIPKRCVICGTPSKGNWFFGYYLPCIEAGCGQRR